MSIKNLLFYGAIFAVVVLVIVFVVKPIVVSLVGTADADSITVGVRNAVSVYMYEDVNNVAHPHDLALVYSEYIVYVKNNDIKGADYTKPIERPVRVEFEGPCSGAYESGVYVRRKEDTVFAVSLKEGDSIDGLYKAILPEIPELKGYTYYGTAEKFDIYEKG